MSHTPGPWHAERTPTEKHWRVITDDNSEEHLCVEELTQDDARLIAAAPELLDALFVALAIIAKDIDEREVDIEQINRAIIAALPQR